MSVSSFQIWHPVNRKLAFHCGSLDHAGNRLAASSGPSAPEAMKDLSGIHAGDN
jgi:hypothetical protein